jgi:hypothetical protein
VADALIVTRSGAGKDIPPVIAMKPRFIEKEDHVLVEHTDHVLAGDRDEAHTTEESAETSESITKSQLPIKITESISLWHRCFAHINIIDLRRILKDRIHVPASHDKHTCDICIRAKHQQKILRIRAPGSNTPFELVHSNLCRPLKTVPVGGAVYYIVYIDNCTRYTHVYFLITETKEEIIQKFKNFKAIVETQGVCLHSKIQM